MVNPQTKDLQTKSPRVRISISWKFPLDLQDLSNGGAVETGCSDLRSIFKLRISNSGIGVKRILKQRR